MSSMRASGPLDLPVALVLHGRIAGTSVVATKLASLTAAAALAAVRAAAVPSRRLAGRRAPRRPGQRPRALYAACRQGLDAVDEHRAILGDLELRALASGHGIEFARLAVSSSVRARRPRDLLVGGALASSCPQRHDHAAR